MATRIFRISLAVPRCQYLLELCRNSSEQIRDASAYWRAVRTALNSSKILVLNGGLKEQPLIVPRFQYLLEFCENSSELLRNASAYWISARRALNSFKMPALTGVL